MKKYLLASAIAFAICLEANSQFHWVQKANFGPGVRYGTISFAIGTKGYVGLGLSSYSPFTYVSDLWEFNPSTNVWTQKANFPGTARHGASSFAIGTKGYVCNGLNNNTSTYFNDLWEYNPSNNTWTQKANFIGAARYTSPSFVIGTNAYVGLGKAVSYYNDFYKYDQAANTWSAIANSGLTASQSGSGFSDGTYGYVVGGANGNTYYKTLWKYFPALNVWSGQGYYPGNASIAYTCFFLNGKGYVGCGTYSNVDYRDFYSYTPSTNTWAPEAPFPATRNSAASMAIGSNGYAGTGASGIYPNITSLYQDFWEFSSCSLTDSITASGSTSFCSGSNVTLNATPAGAGYTYQWYRSQYPVSGATSSSYVATLTGNYQCLVTQTSTGCAKPTNYIPVTVTSTPTGYISPGSAAICSGGNVVLTVYFTGAPSYQWKLNGNSISGATLGTYTASASGTYTVTLTNICGTYTTTGVVVTVYTTVPSPVITANGPTTFCSGSSVTLSTGTGTGFTYQWQNNSVNISGATTNSYSANATGNYRCVVTNPCGSSNSNVIGVTVNPNPSAAITPGGPLSFCTGGSVVLSASTGTGYSYQWKKNGVAIGGATLQTYTANQAGSYTVTVTLGSCSVTSSSVAVYVDQALTPTITGSGFGGFCPSTTVGIETQNGSGYAFQWFEDSHSIPNSNAYQFLTGHNGNYSVNITNGCGTYSSAPYAVTYFDQFGTDHYNIITYSGSLNICSGGGSVSLFNDGMTYYFQPEYQWYKDGVALPGEVNSGYNATAAGSYTCSVRDYVWWCGYGPTVFSNFLVVTTSTGTAPTVSISAGGATSWCGTGSVLLSSSVNTAVSYQWRNNGSNISGATNATYTANTTGNYTCYVSNSCGNATSNSIAVASQTSPIANINNSGSTTFCQGSQVFLYASTGSWTYQWKKNSINISGATNYYYYANASGSYTVTTTNTCGTASSNAIVVTVNLPPTVTISAAGSTTFCAGGSVTLNASSTGTTYQWRKTGINISGATTSSYAVSDSGSYTCFVTNTCGSSNSNIIAVVVNKLPSATITPGGPTTFCDGGSVLLSASVGANRSYQWKKGGINISGATASSYSASIGGNYKVTVTNNVTGCIKTTTPATLVTVNDLPAATITPQGPTTFCAGGSVLLKGNSGTGFTYQWKKGGNNIAGATAKNYTATLGGVYKIKVTNSNGCSRLSSGVLVTVPCKSDGSGSVPIAIGIDVIVYPNPSSGDFTFEIKNSNTEKISIMLYDLTGRLIDVDIKQISNFEFQISNLNAGIYSAVISNEENKKVLKLIKTN